MRPFEILLSITNFLAFLGLALPLPHGFRWVRYSALAAPLIAGAQAMLEGPRAQIAPAYALAGLLFIVWLVQRAQSTGLPGRSGWLKGLGIAAGSVGLAVSIAMPVIFPVFHLPKPTGPYEIGTLTYHWVDADRPEVFTSDPDDHRELMVQIWYPAGDIKSLPLAPYVQDGEALSMAFARLRNVPEILFGNLKYIESNAFQSAPVADEETSYPVLIFLEGITGYRQMNTFQVEELASHGYIVVAVDQPYAAAAVVVFPDGRQAAMSSHDQIRPLIRQSYLPENPAPVLNGQTYEEGIIPYLAADVLFALDQLTALNQKDPNNILSGRLDMERIGILGISGGGIVASEVCRQVPDLRACLFMDAPMTTRVVQTGIQQPGMWITRDAEVMRLEREQAGGWSEEEIRAHLTSMRAVYESLPGDGYFVKVDGIFHIDFTDTPLWSPLFSWIGACGPIETGRAIQIINTYTLAFFDRYVKGEDAALLDGPSSQFSEVTLEIRNGRSKVLKP